MRTVSPFKLNTDSLAWRLSPQTREAAPQPKVEDAIKRIIHDALQASCTVFVNAGNDHWTGSGFHIGGGIVVTASHVAPPELLQSPAEVSVTFDNKSIYPVQVIASDPRSDCALMSNPVLGQAAGMAMLGDSDKAEIGDIVAAIGSPEGWQGTATVGRVSNVHQSMGSAAPTPAWNDMIFVDCDILQGSSGGMVIGTDGLVVGSVMGVTGQHADVGIGERAICPANKIKALLQSAQ